MWEVISTEDEVRGRYNFSPQVVIMLHIQLNQSPYLLYKTITQNTKVILFIWIKTATKQVMFNVKVLSELGYINHEQYIRHQNMS